MAMPQLPQVDREQAITDMIEALAMHEAALASLINAEAAKVDALVTAGIPAATATAEVESFQAAVAGVLQIVFQQQEANRANLELIRAIAADMQKPE